MEKSMSRMLVENVVKQAFKNIKESPERGIRNLIDMALQFAEGSFQKNFFTAAQTMLQDEHSAYYNLVRDTASHTDENRIFTFGMNVGYNSCTVGARLIRGNKEKMGCHIPWTISILMDSKTFDANRETYDTMISEGECLGIYTWMLFAPNDPQTALALAEGHPDSAFCIFCDAEDLSEAFLEEVADILHVMLVVQYDETAADSCAALRERGLLYGVWYQYGQKDTEIIINGDLFASAQQLSPVVTVLVPDKACPNEVRRLAYQSVTQARTAQSYRSIVWELQGDNCLVDTIISGDSRAVGFDPDGDLCDWSGKIRCVHRNLFQNSLGEILMSAFPQNT